MGNSYPKTSVRNISLFINCVIALAVHHSLDGGSFEFGGLDDLWLISAIAFWTISLVAAPWFEAPRDVIANAVAVAVALLAVDLGEATLNKNWLQVLRWGGITYCLIIATVAALSQFLRENRDTLIEAKLVRGISRSWGSGVILYTIPALLSIGGAYASNSYALITLTLFWIAIVVASPVTKTVKALSEFSLLSGPQTRPDIIGTVSRIDDPNIVRVLLDRTDTWRSERVHILSLPNGSQSYVLPLFTQIQGSDVVATGIYLDNCEDKIPMDTGCVAIEKKGKTKDELVSKICGHTNGVQIAGFVIEGSTIARIKFEVPPDTDLSEGDIVYCPLRSQEVYYQVVAAETAEEVILSNPRGTQFVYATQIGAYDAGKGFLKYPWLPSMNQLVFTAKDIVFPEPLKKESEFAIGKLPGMELEVMANMNDLLEYHSAILGITGTGKTEVAFSIIKEAVDQGIKIFAVDFTTDYGKRLANLDPQFLSPSSKESDDLEEKFFAVETGEFKAGAEKRALKNAVDALAGSTKTQVDDFLRQSERNLAIFELPGISNTRATLALTELYLTTIMTWAKTNRSDQRVLIVLEEAHTIVPETAGTGMDFETKRVVDRIGQIALQGRKYGVGLLVITQRTALVSKTILSQCNTFFTHSLIDQTSLKFLESVYSTEHTKIIPNLKPLHFLASGKALKAERPIMLEREFDEEIKKASEAIKRPLVIHTEGAPIEGAQGETTEPMEDLDDEIPF